MKTLSITKRITLAAVSFAVLATAAIVTRVSAIPYTGDNTPAATSPQFNVYTNVPSIGDEADFLRGKVSTGSGYTDTVNDACVAGTKYTLRVYVHNGASDKANDNGNGPSVAHGTKVKVTLPGSEAASFQPSATISASNAPTVNDSMTLNCNGKKVTLSYIAGTASQYTIPGGTQALSDSIVTTGAPVGTISPNGDVWGCSDQRVWVLLQVVVKDIPTPPPATAICVAPAVVLNNEQRKVTVTANGTATNAQIVGYEINWGDNTPVSTDKTATHEYSKDGTYTITTRIQVKYTDGSTKWITGADCNKTITIKKPDVKMPVCDVMTLKPTSGRSVLITVSVKNLTNVMKIKNVVYNFGDTKTESTDKTSVTHTYDKDGTYAVTVKITVTIDGKDVVIDSSDCAQNITFKGDVPPTVVPPVTPPTPPLPVTGAASTAGIFTIVAALAGGVHYFVRRRMAL